MHSTLNFVKRHRGKICAGAAFVGSLYFAKKVLETNSPSVFIDNVKEIFVGCREVPADEEIEECLAEARRHFLFDVHQQSCDKALRKFIPEISEKIAIRFNTEELLDELRSSPKPNPERKIQIWEQLKSRSLCRLVSLINIYPLAILVLKSQKAIICQQCLTSRCNKAKVDGNDSIFSRGISFVHSLLFVDENDKSIQRANDSNANSTELFNNLTVYFRENGIALLMDVVEQVVCQIFDKISLSEQFNANDFLFLVERIRARIEGIRGENNFVDFVVPNSEINLENVGVSQNMHLRLLFRHLIDVLKSRNARQLMKDFGDKYLEGMMKHLDEAMSPANGTLELAKIIPLLCDAYAKIGTTVFGSIFHSLLSSTELHQFTFFVSECSKREDLFGGNTS